MQRFHVELNQLVINPTINPRHAADEDVSDLVATIKANGFSDALLVRSTKEFGGTEDEPQMYEVIDGSRRMRALKHLNWTDIVPVDAIEADDHHAREIALAANVARRDLSPADESEAFTALHKGGLDAGEIAARFGTTKKLVRQRIAIGSLPKPIIDALRAGTIDVDVAEAFTINPSAERQLTVFGKGANLTEWGVRRAMTEDSVSDSDYRFSFVGHTAYMMAGGRINEDLFGQTSYLTDIALLQTLFDEKIKNTVQQLKDDGWKWVKLLDGQNVWNHKFERQTPRGKAERNEEQKSAIAAQVEHLKALQAEYEQMDAQDGDIEFTDEQQDRFQELGELIAVTESSLNDLNVKPFTQKQMASLGVLLLCKDHGVEVSCGYQAPEDKKAQAKDKIPDPDAVSDEALAEAEGAAPVKAETAGYSDAMEMQLLAVALDCTRIALTQKPAMAYRLGLAARVCAFLNVFWLDGETLYPPFASVREQHMDDKYENAFHKAQDSLAACFEGCTTFMDVAARLETLPPETLVEIEAVLTASLLNVTALKNTDAQALINHAAPNMRSTGFAPDAEFFKGISRDQLLLISAEIDDTNLIKKAKKPDMVQALVPLVAASGWLPPQLRTPSYTGPGSADYNPSPLAGEGAEHSEAGEGNGRVTSEQDAPVEQVEAA